MGEGTSPLHWTVELNCFSYVLYFMLRFQTPPDKILMVILTENIEMMIDQIRETLSVHRKKEVDL